MLDSHCSGSQAVINIRDYGVSSSITVRKDVYNFDGDSECTKLHINDPVSFLLRSMRNGFSLVCFLILHILFSCLLSRNMVALVLLEKDFWLT